MKQTPRPHFGVGIEISWNDLCHFPDALANGMPFKRCVYTGIIQCITREDVYIDIHMLTFSDGTSTPVHWREQRVSKSWLASYATDETICQQVEETLPTVSDPYTIYALRDPRDRVVHYIGVSRDLQRRYREHMRCIDKNALKTAWVRQLQAEGLQPEMVPLETVKGAKKGYEREHYWLQSYSEQGAPLTNVREDAA